LKIQDPQNILNNLFNGGMGGMNNGMGNMNGGMGGMRRERSTLDVDDDSGNVFNFRRNERSVSIKKIDVRGAQLYIDENNKAVFCGPDIPKASHNSAVLRSRPEDVKQ